MWEGLERLGKRSGEGLESTESEIGGAVTGVHAEVSNFNWDCYRPTSLERGTVFNYKTLQHISGLAGTRLQLLLNTHHICG